MARYSYIRPRQHTRNKKQKNKNHHINNVNNIKQPTATNRNVFGDARHFLCVVAVFEQSQTLRIKATNVGVPVDENIENRSETRQTNNFNSTNSLARSSLLRSVPNELSVMLNARRSASNCTKDEK
jgi:hypothetical protein